jgi:uncharacterized protein involved in type VI secretion and phage assembly
MKAGDIRGLTIGIVVDVDDPEHQGRVKLQFPWLDAQLTSDWVSMTANFAGNDRGIFFMPEAGDELVVAFLHGDFNHPYVLGVMWNGQAIAPSLDPRQRMIRSKNGITIRFVDSTPNSGDCGALIIEDPHGNLITMSNGMVTVQAVGLLQLQAGQIVLKGTGWSRTVMQTSEPI